MDLIYNTTIWKNWEFDPVPKPTLSQGNTQDFPCPSKMRDLAPFLFESNGGESDVP